MIEKTSVFQLHQSVKEDSSVWLWGKSLTRSASQNKQLI